MLESLDKGFVDPYEHESSYSSQVARRNDRVWVVKAQLPWVIAVLVRVRCAPDQLELRSRPGQSGRSTVRFRPQPLMGRLDGVEPLIDDVVLEQA